MSKFVNVSVEVLLDTDFYIEVEDNATKENIEYVAKQNTTLPNKYPEILNKFLKERFNLEVKGLDSLLKSWNIKNINYIINESTEA